MANGPATAPDQKTRLKSIIGGSAGNLVEWYDWYVYSAFTLYFAPVFFPSGNQTAELLSAAAVFAVGFLMRPIGAWFMGTYADRKGRKAGLTLSVTLMCLGSLLIAITPGHDAIGIAAPLTTVLVRAPVILMDAIAGFLLVTHSFLPQFGASPAATGTAPPA